MMTPATKRAREEFDVNMQKIADANGIHPKTSLEHVGGPDFANRMYEAMFGVFMAGIEYGYKNIFRN